MRTLLAVAAIAFSPFACGDEETTSPTPPENPTGALVVFAHGGGIAAMPRLLEVDRDGHATLTVTVVGKNGPKNEMSEFDLSESELSTLQDQLTAAAGDDGPTEPTGCADCFTFSIEADDINVDLDQVSIEDVSDELSTLVATLERLSTPKTL